MRTIVSHLVLPVLTFALGSIAATWWVSSNPRAKVHYHYRSTSIPATSGMMYDSYTEVHLWNSGRRFSAHDVTLEIRIPTSRDVGVGAPDSPEDASNVHLAVDRGQPDSSEAVVTLRADRLAPGSYVLAPIWWRSENQRELRIRGSASTGVITEGEVQHPGESTSALQILLTALTGCLAAVVVAVFAYVTQRKVAATQAVESQRLSEDNRKLMEGFLDVLRRSER